MRIPFGIEVLVGEEYLTAPYNHVHHAQSLRFMEESRAAFLRELGIPLEGFLGRQLFLVVTAISVAYKREVGVGRFRVTCEDPRVEGKTASVEQRIFNEKGKVAVEANVKFMCLSGETRRAIAFPAELVEAFRDAREQEAAAALTG